MNPRSAGAKARHWTAAVFNRVEQVFYVAIALGLTVGGVVLLGHVGWTFARDLKTGMVPTVLHLLDGVLLIFILTELIHTIGAIIDDNAVTTEPFLIIGIVAAVRRLLVITAHAPETAGPAFREALWEVGALVFMVIGLGVTIYLVRHTSRSEPRPAHAPDPDEE